MKFHLFSFTGLENGITCQTIPEGFVRAYLSASTTKQDATRAPETINSFVLERSLRVSARSGRRVWFSHSQGDAAQPVFRLDTVQFATVPFCRRGRGQQRLRRSLIENPMI
jgi:hypothetical protein